MSEIIYVSELAGLLGKTECSIRQLVHRKNDEAIPPHFKLGNRLAWRRSTVMQWLDKKDAKSAKILG